MSRRILGVIDVGSNTVRSLIVEARSDGGYRVLDDERDVARLASGLDRGGRLSLKAMRRAVSALDRMAEIGRARGVRRMAVVATSAIREARNRRAFLDRVRARTGLRVQVISEEEEAALAFESAAQSFDLGDQPCAVADVGGGSTEVIQGLGSHIQRVDSLRLGAVALTEEFLRSDPVKRSEFRAVRRKIRRHLARAHIAPDLHPQFLIASGGTATAVAQMAMARQGLLGRPAHGFEMTQAELLHLRQALLRRTLPQRRQMPGLSSDRADIIIAGVAILYEILAHLKVNTLRVSAYGIRHALLNRMMARRRPGGLATRAHPQRLAAAAAFARSLRFEEAHARQVQRLALSLFDQLSAPLGIEPATRDLLAAAALLHDVGYVVSYRAHHKHSYRLIAHAQLDGFTPREREVIALTARYHRRSGPKKKHKAWSALAGPDRRLVARLSALLRIADALDRRHSQGLKDVRCRVTRRHIHIDLAEGGNLTVERHAAEEKSKLFWKTFGREVVFRTARARLPARAAVVRRGLRLLRRAIA